MKFKVWIVLGLFVCAILNGKSQDDSVFILQNPGEENPIELELRFNVRKYQKERYSDKYVPALLSYRISENSTEKEVKVKIKARGINRLERCSFPPLFINFKNSDVQINDFRSTKKIKLVTHCGGKPYQNYVLKEYLAYRLYNIISPYSYRVRLARMKYIDSGRDNKVTEAWGILKEPDDMLSTRLNVVPAKVDYVNLKHTDTLWTSYMAIFQYLIGNPDFSIFKRHNVKLFMDTDPFNNAPIPVPYDFDYSGLVDAFYAVPSEELDIVDVRTRVFLGPCRCESEYKEIINYFIEKKSEIYTLISTFDYLPQKERDVMLQYLDDFYDKCSHQRFIKNFILVTCR